MVITAFQCVSDGAQGVCGHSTGMARMYWASHVTTLPRARLLAVLRREVRRVRRRRLALQQLRALQVPQVVPEVLAQDLWRPGASSGVRVLARL